MEIESIMLYTCYEINIVLRHRTLGDDETLCAIKSQEKITCVAFLRSDCCAAGKNFRKHFHLLSVEKHRTYLTRVYRLWRVGECRDDNMI